MTSEKDPRKVVNARIHAKVTHITCMSQCSRLYGALAKTKYLDGTVTRVLVDQTIKRARTFIEAVWFYNKQKQVIKQIALCNVIAGPTLATLAAERLSKEQEKSIDKLVQQDSWDQEESLDEDQSNVFDGEVEDMSSNIAQSAQNVDWHIVEVTTPIGGPIQRRYWHVRTCAGDIIRGGGVSTNKLFFYFMTMFPHKHLSQIVALTNICFMAKNEKLTTPVEVLNFFWYTATDVKMEVWKLQRFMVYRISKLSATRS